MNIWDFLERILPRGIHGGGAGIDPPPPPPAEFFAHAGHCAAQHPCGLCSCSIRRHHPTVYAICSAFADSDGGECD